MFKIGWNRLVVTIFTLPESKTITLYVIRRVGDDFKQITKTLNFFWKNHQNLENKVLKPWNWSEFAGLCLDTHSLLLYNFISLYLFYITQYNFCPINVSLRCCKKNWNAHIEVEEIFIERKGRLMSYYHLAFKVKWLERLLGLSHFEI